MTNKRSHRYRAAVIAPMLFGLFGAIALAGPTGGAGHGPGIGWVYWAAWPASMLTRSLLWVLCLGVLQYSIIGFAIDRIILHQHFMRANRNIGKCKHCGYCLDRLRSSRCPECGAPIHDVRDLR